ncbi:hypothetical protein EON83_07200 [bacterium]|nr:MAG: hypothetical protein EON83_07200 [bacterium]
MLRQTLPLLLAFVPITVNAQTQTPILIQSGGAIQIPVPAGANAPRIQVLIAGSNTILDDERANIKDGVANGRLEADPGTYDVRLVTNDKNRTPISASFSFQIPGFKREAGRWLFNGSPIVYAGTNPATATTFLPNLRRDKKTKLPLSSATNGALKWDVAELRLNPYTKDSGVAALNGLLASNPAQTLLGIEVGEEIGPASTNFTPYDPVASTADWKSLRAALDAKSPDVALVLEAATMPLIGLDRAAQRLETLSPLADAIVVPCGQPALDDRRMGQLSSNDQTLLKIARRNVEESPNFDLPVFASFSVTPSASDTLRAFQSGASNIIVPEGASNPVLDVISSQSARFTGAVTLEDVGLRVADFDRFAPHLRRAGRSPLLGRLPGEGNSDSKDNGKNAESLMVAFSASTDVSILDKVEKAVKIGATIYCEGTLPPALLPRWAEITKTQIAPLTNPQKAIVTLSDPWFWGTINDKNFDVSQSVAVTVKPSISAQTKDVKGLAREVIARPIARFTDDSNAIMLCPVDKGRIIWAPFDVSPPVGFGRVRTKIGLGLIYDNDLTPANSLYGPILSSYYAALAGAMQAGLAEYSATKGDASNVSVNLRAIPADPKDPKSTAISLIAFFNSSDEEIDLNAEVRGNGNYALDLMTSKTVPVKVRDFGIRMTLQIPPNGFRWLAIAQDEQAWNNTGKSAVKAQIR